MLEFNCGNARTKTRLLPFGSHGQKVVAICHSDRRAGPKNGLLVRESINAKGHSFPGLAVRKSTPVSVVIPGSMHRFATSVIGETAVKPAGRMRAVLEQKMLLKWIVCPNYDLSRFTNTMPHGRVITWRWLLLPNTVGRS